MQSTEWSRMAWQWAPFLPRNPLPVDRQKGGPATPRTLSIGKSAAERRSDQSDRMKLFPMSSLFMTILVILLLYCLLWQSHGHTASPDEIQAINTWSNETFGKINHKSMRKLQKTVRHWAGLHIGEPKIPVMYFFSGADLYTMMGLFPQAPAYALVAEFFRGNITCFRDPQCFISAQVKASSWFSHVETRAFGYSVTTSMRQFFAPPLGILPAILIILRTFNHVVASVTTTETGFTIKTNRAIICYERKFIYNVDDLKHLLSLKSMPPKPWAVMFKAGAHELARNPWFTNNILANSAMVVQDETGLRATAFQGNWTVKAYGQYHPFTGNGTRFVEDMEEFRELFGLTHPQPLPFCFGYCSEYHTRGMLIVAENHSLKEQRSKLLTDFVIEKAIN